MRLTFVAPLALAAVLVGSVPGAAAPSPAPSKAPIRIDHAELWPVLDGSADPQGNGFADIWFRNLSDKPAIQIQFAIEGTDNTPKLILTDKGSFKKGAIIQHHYPMLVRDRNLHVIVIKATFADGSTWEDTGDD
jgi:hypothetical protein